MNLQETKKCPFCGEKIPIDTVKCSYCGEPLNPSEHLKNPKLTIFGGFLVIIGFLLFLIGLLTFTPQMGGVGIFMFIGGIILSIIARAL